MPPPSARGDYKNPNDYDKELVQFNKDLDSNKVTPRGKGGDDSGDEQPAKDAADEPNRF
jgi:hypothetical protein